MEESLSLSLSITNVGKYKVIVASDFVHYEKGPLLYAVNVDLSTDFLSVSMP